MKNAEKSVLGQVAGGQFIRSAVLIGATWGLADLYIGSLNATLSWRVYLAFFVAYILSCVILALIVWVILKKIKSSKSFPIRPVIFTFIVILFVYSFIIASAKINGWFNLLNIRAVGTVILLISGTGILAVLLMKINTLKELIESKYGMWPVVFSISWGLTIYSYFLLNFSQVLTDKLKVMLSLLGMAFLPIIIILLIGGTEIVLQHRIKKVYPRRIAISLFLLLLCLITPLLVSLDFFKNETKKVQPVGQAVLDKPNVILIVMDTARKDHLSCYGASRKTTPNIDQFSKEGILFTRYISTAPWTIPSHASLFTGMFTSKHGARFTQGERVFSPLPKECVTLAEVLQANGWKTIGISANTILSHKSNFDQGFDFYYAKLNDFRDFFWGSLCGIVFKEIWNKWNFLRINVSRLSSDINRLVYRQLDQISAEPFFLFINYMEPHHGLKYLPGKYNRLYGNDWGDWQKMYDSLDIDEIVHKRKAVSEAEKQINDNWLDNKMQFMDFHIGQLFKKLKELNFYDNSIIILLSDHGDLFGEHYSFGHSMELYHELIHVPLIIKYPTSLGRTGICNTVVQNIDLMPQILTDLGLPLPDGIQGQKFADINHEIISELFRRGDLTYNKPRYDRDLKAIYDFQNQQGYYKYIQATNGDNELFDIKADSLELKNIISENPDLAQSLIDRLFEWRKAIRPVIDTSQVQQKIDQKTKERLKALGYVR